MRDEQWVELCQVSSEVEAEVIRSLLIAADIPVMMRSSLARSVYPALSQVKILVPRKDLDSAQEVISEHPDEPNP